MLSVDIGTSTHSEKMTGIEFTRSIPRDSGIALDYFIMGITIEVNDLK
jgi:hypothetical protein